MKPRNLLGAGLKEKLGKENDSYTSGISSVPPAWSRRYQIAVHQRPFGFVLFIFYFSFLQYNNKGTIFFSNGYLERFRCINLRSDFRKSSQTACKGQTTSDRIAECFYEAAKKNFPDRRIRTDYSDNDPDWEENFYILRHSLCPAVLTENFFMDNHSDLEYLQSRAGKQAVVDTHVEGIVEYLSSL